MHSQVCTFFLTLNVRHSLSDWWAGSPQLPNSARNCHPYLFWRCIPNAGRRACSSWSLTGWVFSYRGKDWRLSAQQVPGFRAEQPSWAWIALTVTGIPQGKSVRNSGTTPRQWSYHQHIVTHTYVPVTFPLPAKNWIDTVLPTSPSCIFIFPRLTTLSFIWLYFCPPVVFATVWESPN